MSWRLLLSAFVGGILLGVAGWLLWPAPPEPERSAAELMDVVMWGREPIGGPFALIDHNGQVALELAAVNQTEIKESNVNQEWVIAVLAARCWPLSAGPRAAHDRARACRG
jgi:hypothetical protein